MLFPTITVIFDLFYNNWKRRAFRHIVTHDRALWMWHNSHCHSKWNQADKKPS